MLVFTVFILSLGLSLCSVYVMKLISTSIGALDIPRDNRRMHEETVPRGGGVAVFFSLILTFLFALFERGETLFSLSGAFLSGGALIVGIGLCDDIFSLSPKAKLFSQLLVSFIPISFGFQAEGISFFSVRISFSYPFSLVFSLLWMLCFINAFNLIDGLDALATGVAVICSLSLFVCFYGGDWEWNILIVSLCGACLGFLPYNRHKASIFLGDSGSLFLGFSFGLLSLSAAGSDEPSPLPILTLFLIFAFPICDLLFAVARRIYHKKSIFSADTGHFHHRILSLGFTQKASVRILLFYSLLLALLGISFNFAFS